MVPRQAESDTVDEDKGGAKAVAGKFRDFLEGVSKWGNGVTGVRQSMISGPERCGSVLGTSKEAGGRSFSTRPEPAAGAEAVHAW